MVGTFQWADRKRSGAILAGVVSGDPLSFMLVL